MAFRKAAVGVAFLWGQAFGPAAGLLAGAPGSDSGPLASVVQTDAPGVSQAAEHKPHTFPVRHEHLRNSCEGTMTVDETGVRFVGPKDHAWFWKYEDIQELRLEPKKIHVLTYKDSKLRLGADRAYDFKGNVPAEELYRFWKDRLDQRFVAALTEPPADDFAIPVKHLKRVVGSEGMLAFGPNSIVYSTEKPGESRTWRYSDIDSISTSGPFQLTITTFERARSHYGDRKGFNFELKEPLTEERYNQVWLDIEKKNGKILQ